MGYSVTGTFTKLRFWIYTDDAQEITPSVIIGTAWKYANPQKISLEAGVWTSVEIAFGEQTDFTFGGIVVQGSSAKYVWIDDIEFLA